MSIMLDFPIYLLRQWNMFEEFLLLKHFAQSVESFDKLYSLIIKVKDNVLKLTMSYTNKNVVV